MSHLDFAADRHMSWPAWKEAAPMEQIRVQKVAR